MSNIDMLWPADENETETSTPQVVETETEACPLDEWINSAAVEVAHEAKALVEESKAVEEQAKHEVGLTNDATEYLTQMAKEASLAEQGLEKAYEMLLAAEEKAEKDMKEALARKRFAQRKAVEANTSMALKLGEIRARRQAKQAKQIKIEGDLAKESLVNIEIELEAEAKAKEANYEDAFLAWLTK